MDVGWLNHSEKQERGAPGRGLKVVRAFTNSWGGGGFTEFDVEFKFAKIQNSYVRLGGGGLVEPTFNF